MEVEELSTDQTLNVKVEGNWRNLKPHMCEPLVQNIK